MSHRSTIEDFRSAQPYTTQSAQTFCARCGRDADPDRPCCAWCGYRHGRALALSRRILAWDATLIAVGIALDRLILRLFR